MTVPADPIERLAQHVSETQWRHLPEPAALAAKTFLLDTIGVAAAGTAAPYADQLRTAARRWGTGGEARVIGLPERLPAPSAALLNGFHAHNQEFDCLHERAVVHAMATIVAAALAVAERRRGVSGRDLLLAAALGVDVSATIGIASRARMSFFRPATAGIFGATAAAAKLAGLDRAAILDAFGLAYSQAAGTMQSHVEGKPALALQVGMAARAAVNAVDLAALGFAGPHQVLEGPFGYFRLMEGSWELSPLLQELGKTWRISELSHKPFPTGRATHAGIDAIQRLMAREPFAPDAVKRLTLLAPPLIHQLVARAHQPEMSASYARLCFPYVGAVAITRRDVGLGDFSPERLADPALALLAARIEVAVDDNPDRNAMSPQTVRVELFSGKILQERVEHAVGNPQNPLDRDRHLAKFRQCWRSGLAPLDPAAGERLIRLVDRLEDLADIGALLDHLVPQ
jgi:2-methylcitrate dehydratase PrpD